MATTSQILDLGQDFKKISAENFKAADKILLLWEGVKITLDNTRDENKRTLQQLDDRLNKQASELAKRITELKAAEERAAAREAEYTRQTNAYAELAGEYAKTSAYLEEVKNTVELTTAQLQQVEAASAQAANSFQATIAAKDSLLAEEIKLKFDALDQATKLGNDVAALMKEVEAEQLARQQVIETHEADNDKILAMVKELFEAQVEEDRDIREAANTAEGNNQ